MNYKNIMNNFRHFIVYSVCTLFNITNTNLKTEKIKSYEDSNDI